MKDENAKQLKVAFTGGPFAGKSTTLEELAKLDTDKSFVFIPEASTQIISEETNLKKPTLPHTDFVGFQNLVSKRQVSLENFALSTKYDAPVAFFDRTGIDNIGYCNLTENTLSDDVLEAVGQRRYDLVFSFDLLPGYKPDKIRHETPEIRDSVHKHLTKAYKDLGYKVVSVPVLPPKERAQFILYKTLKQLSNKLKDELSVPDPRESDAPKFIQFTDISTRKVYFGTHNYFIPSSAPGDHTWAESQRYDVADYGAGASLAHAMQKNKAAEMYHVLRKEKGLRHSIDGFVHLGAQFNLSAYESKEIMWDWARNGILRLNNDREYVTFVPEHKRGAKNAA